MKKKIDLEIRPYVEADLKIILQLFKDTIYTVNKKDYDSKQLAAWVEGMNVEKFKTSLLCHETLVACINHQIVGFADMDKTGYLDHCMCIRIIKEKELQVHCAMLWKNKARRLVLKRIPP